MLTSTTAPTVAAANENKNVFECTIPNSEKIHPPITDPINPNTMSPMHPKPAPRDNFPASHPAINPINNQPSNPRRHSTTTTRSCHIIITASNPAISPSIQKTCHPEGA